MDASLEVAAYTQMVAKTPGPDNVAEGAQRVVAVLARGCTCSHSFEVRRPLMLPQSLDLLRNLLDLRVKMTAQEEGSKEQEWPLVQYQGQYWKSRLCKPVNHHKE
jgi:hypothetical protein